MTAAPTPLDCPLPADDFDLTLEAGRAEKHYWLDLWRYRELFLILALRDISVRYKQTAIGAIWSLIQPALTMIVMTVVFGRVAGLHSDGAAPYALLVFAAMLPWMFFSSALFSSSQSLVGNAHLIAKIYFPRLIIPASSVATSFADFLVSFLLLLILMVWYRVGPTWNMLALPAFVGIAFLAALGPGMLIAALNVKYRDFRYIIPFLIQLGLYVTPVGFSSALIREKFGETGFLLYSLNPMVGVIDGFRWAILGSGSTIDILGLSLSVSVVILFLVVGVSYFRQTEKAFADVI